MGYTEQALIKRFIFSKGNCQYVQTHSYRLFRLHGAAARVAGCHPLRRGIRPAPVADLRGGHRGQYAASAGNLFSGPKGAGVGTGQSR